MKNTVHSNRILKLTASVLSVAVLMGSAYADNILEAESHERGTVFAEEIPDDFIVPKLEGTTGRPRLFISRQPVQGEILPEKYDSRLTGRITEVKDQRPWQLCWAFSALAAAESSLISGGYADADINLSEMHLGYFFDGAARDELGNTAGDATLFRGSTYLESGNNNKYTTFALANWIGGADESRYPYDDSFYDGSQTDSAAWDDTAHLKNAYWISATDVDEIKKAVMKYGAVGLSYYYKLSNYNSETSSYYNKTFTTTNHAVTVVGWDDSYSAENFNDDPGRDGAWLIKNSLGMDTNNNGYFWLSYADESITSAGATAFVFEFEPAWKYEHNYHYDGACGTQYDSVASGGSVAAVFTAKANDDGRDEILKAVGMGIAATDVNYSVQVYTELSDPADPVSGTAAFAVPVSGKTRTCGFYTVELPKAVKLYQGELFSIVITLEKAGASAIEFFVDKTYDNGNWISFISNEAEGETFARNPNMAWGDLADKAETARLKAYTADSGDEPALSLKFEKEEVNIQVGDTYTQLPSVSPQGASVPKLFWSSSGNSVTVDSSGTVRAAEPGTAVIAAKNSSGTICSSYTVTVSPYVESLSFPKESLELTAGDEVAVELIISPNGAVPAEEIRWSSSDSDIVRAEGGIIYARRPGTAVITAKAGLRTAECVVVVKQPILNAQVTIKPAVFDGANTEIEAAVTVDGKILCHGVDYTVSTRGEIRPGSSTAVITGKGLYYGSVYKNFEVTLKAPAVTADYLISTGRPYLKWAAVDGAVRYEIYRAGSKTSEPKLLGSTDKLNYTDTTAGTGYGYYYSVTAVSEDGARSESSTAVFGRCHCAQVTAHVDYRTTTGKPYITWNTVDGAAKYEVYRSGSRDGSYTLVSTCAGTSYTDTKANAGYIYYYKIKAVSSVNTAANSYMSAAVHERCHCAKPVVTITTYGGHPYLRWSAVTGAASYDIYRSTDGKNYVKYASTTGNGYVNNSASAGAVYYYKVIAVSPVSTAANSAYSNLVSIRAK